jgi:hypothetical protein
LAKNLRKRINNVCATDLILSIVERLASSQLKRKV